MIFLEIFSAIVAVVLAIGLPTIFLIWLGIKIID